MRPITPKQLFDDLGGWLTSDAGAIEQARKLKGGGGWEQWAIVQFLRWQLNAQPHSVELDYRRELPLWSKQRRRRFDIGYNAVTVDPQQGFPLILTQWKAGNDGNYVSSEVTADLGTLAEFAHIQGMEPIILALCAEPVYFPGVAVSGPINGTSVRLYYSTTQTWQMVGGFQVA